MGREFRNCRATFGEIAETLLEVLLKVNHGISLIDSHWEFWSFLQFVQEASGQQHFFDQDSYPHEDLTFDRK